MERNGLTGDPEFVLSGDEDNDFVELVESNLSKASRKVMSGERGERRQERKKSRWGKPFIASVSLR